MIYSLLRPLLFRFDPETIHEWVVRLSRAALGLPLVEPLLTTMLKVDDPVTLAGIRFPNRLGLAAGFDKNGHFFEVARALGFGHIEVGAITPLPQPGHPRPRLFRVAGEPSLRNRMGFNNDGAAAILSRLPAGGFHHDMVVGVNLGKGLATPVEEAAADYISVMRAACFSAAYFSINISSPNTADLRQLGRGNLLRDLCLQLVECNRQLPQPRPLLVKVSPDESDDQLKEVAAIARQTGLDGLIATNTTVQRQGRYAQLDSLGGLSGLALSQRSPQVVRLLRQEVGPDFPIIGVGGVLDIPSARAMRAAGADLVQIYTGFIYGGPGLPSRLAKALKEAQ